jgi:hypothetical protein
MGGSAAWMVGARLLAAHIGPKLLQRLLQRPIPHASHRIA